MGLFEGKAVKARGKDIRKIALVVIGTQLNKQIQYLVDSPHRFAAGPIHFVDDNNRSETFFEGFAQHKARLGHRAFVGIDQQQAALNHAQHPFDFTAKVSVSGGIDNIN